jgi:hypothetical protein
VEPLAARWWGPVGSADIGHHLPLLGLVGPAGAVDSVGSVGVAAVGAVGALAGQPVAAVGSSDDRLGSVVVGGRDSRCTARPPRWRPRWRTAPRGGPTGTARPLTVGGEGARIERSKHRAQGRGGRPARRLAVAIARWRTASGLRAGMPRPWRVKALRSDSQVVPRWGGGVDAAQPFGQREGALGLAPVGEEPAGLPAHPSTAGHARPTVAAGEGSTQHRRWVDRLRSTSSSCRVAWCSVHPPGGAGVLWRSSAATRMARP